MPGIQATAVAHQRVRSDEVYRALFHSMSAGAAYYRLIIDRDEVVGAALLDSNRAFEPYHAALPQLLGVLARSGRAAASATHQLCIDAVTLSVTVHPVADDEVMVVIEGASSRAQLEQQLRELRGRFAQVFHGNAAAMVIASRSDLRIIDVNPRWLELFAATRDEVIGRTSIELGLITETGAHERIAQHLQFSNGHDTELALHTRDGASVTVLASAKPIEIAEGFCTLTTLIDITGRKQAEEAFAVAFGASPAGMILVDDASDIVVAVNQRILDMTRGRDDLVGRATGDLALVRRPAREELLAQIAQSGRIVGVEVELACKDGTGIWTIMSTERITLHDKVHRLSVFTDITERKQFERRLLTQHRVGLCLAEASEIQAAISEVIETLCRDEGWDSGVVWLTGPDGVQARCARWSAPGVTDAAVTDELGRTLLAAVLTTGAAHERRLEPAGGAPHDAVGFPILRGTTVLGVVALAAQHRHSVLDLDARGLFESIGRSLGLFVERSRAEASLRELNSELERRVLERTLALQTSNRDLESFSSSVSHDLRAPLRAIHGFSQILLTDFAEQLPDEARGLLARIHASGGRLRALIDGLLTYSRLGRDEVHRIQIDLEAQVRSVFDELVVGRDLADRVELRILPLGAASADPVLLRSVWMNLLENALKYSRDRDRIVIEVGRETEADEPVYYVCDNGVGFDMKYADRLFGVFQRLHASAVFEGTGIGLANVRRIIERHHGRVTASSELGRGSKFSFTLGSGM